MSLGRVHYSVNFTKAAFMRMRITEEAFDAEVVPRLSRFTSKPTSHIKAVVFSTYVGIASIPACDT